MRFRDEVSFEQRLEEGSRVLNKYPDRVPIICEKCKTAPNDCPDIDKKKYLVPRELNMGQYMLLEKDYGFHLKKLYSYLLVIQLYHLQHL
jgi:hypothetical protein